MARLDASTVDELARAVMRALAFHSAYLEPQLPYQFALPDGRYLTVMDALVKRTRMLMFFGRAPANPARKISVVVSRPRRLPKEGAWFVDYTDRETRKAHKLISNAIMFSYGSSLGGADATREPNMLQIDPRAPLERLEWVPTEGNGA